MKGSKALGYEFETTDFSTVGSGIAGLCAALQAAKHGKVLLIAKDKLNVTATNLAQGGIAAAVSEGDSPKLHLQDTLEAGAGLCRREAVEILVQDGPKRVADFIEMGIAFDRDSRTPQYQTYGKLICKRSAQCIRKSGASVTVEKHWN